VPPAVKAAPQEPFQPPAPRTDLAAQFRGSPVYQHYEGQQVAPSALAFQAQATSPSSSSSVKKEQRREIEHVNTKRPDLQLYGPFSGAVKRLRVGEPASPAYQTQQQHVVHAVEDEHVSKESSSFFNQVSDPEPMHYASQQRPPHKFTSIKPALQTEKTAFDEQFFWSDPQQWHDEHSIDYYIVGGRERELHVCNLC